MGIPIEEGTVQPCLELLIEAVKEGIKAVTTNREKSQESTIKAGFNFLGFVICQALAQRQQATSCHCPARSYG
jgi:hypothetical protein